MPVAQKRLLIIGGLLMLSGALFGGVGLAIHKSYWADGVGGIVFALGEVFIMLSLIVAALARGE